MKARWDDFWFRPQSPIDLAVFRFIYFASIYYLKYVVNPVDAPDGLDHSIFPDSMWWPVGILKAVPVAPVATLVLLHHVVRISLLLAAIGFATRLSSIVAAALMLYLFGLDGIHGKMFYFTAVPVMMTMLLALGRTSDALSIDHLIAKKFAWWPFARANPEPSGSYRWPLALCGLYATMVYSLASISKLRESGLGWAWSDNLQTLFAATATNQGCIAVDPPYPALNTWLAHHATLARLLATATLVIELGAPLALVRKWWRWLVLAALIGMNVSFYFTTSIDFRPLLAAASCFVPWESTKRLAGRLFGR